MSLATDILPFIPQRYPFVMIDTLETCEPERAVTSFNVKEDNIFTENNILTEPALIENIAQTAAVHMGYISHTNNKPVAVGFIGAVQQLKIWRLPTIGQQLQTSVKIINQIFNATIVEGEIICDGEKIAHCEMRIFIDK